MLVFLAALGQAALVVQARPQDLITGAHGIADILRRAWPPDLGKLPGAAWPTLETVDIALFGTVVGVILALPLATLAARNTAPGRPLYYAARAAIAFARAVPDLIWALIFVTAVGLGPFPGALAISVHSVGMLGRLFAEVIEDMDMGPMEALADDRGDAAAGVQPRGGADACCPRCSASRSIASTRTSAPRSCSASSAPAGSASRC